MKRDWNSVLATLRSRGQSINGHVNTVRNRVSKVILVPMLEDDWTESKWLEAMRVIAGQLDRGDKIQFRRSSVPGDDAPPSSITARLKNGQNFTFTSTRLEAHRSDHGGPAKVISNDGGIVYQATPIGGRLEDQKSLVNGDAFATTAQ